MVDEYSDDDVVARVRWRLENVEPLLITAQEMGEKAPFWAIARILFPVAESLAWLLHAEENTGTSARLSWLLREVLSNRKSAYRDMASIICQVWRHGLTHGDEPPLLVIDSPMTASGERETSNAKAMSWKLALGSCDHLKVSMVSAQMCKFSFCLVHFYDDLIDVTKDAELWANIPKGQAKDRYNRWTIKYLDEEKGAEPKRSIDEIKKLFRKKW